MREAARVVGWGLVLWAGVQVAAAIFSRNATAAVAVQAVLAEWGAGLVAISWSDPNAPAPSWSAIGGRAGRGAAMGLLAAALVVGVALLAHVASFVRSPPAVGLLAVGLVVSVLGAVRDELLLRGVVLRATRGVLPTWAALLVCGAAAAAARFGVEGAMGLVLAGEAIKGAALGAIWVKDRGAWMAVAANTAWTWTVGSVVGGGLLDVRFH
ncbi:MAG TPA: CPBP family glutamic-type intramembrane protease [Polyangiaceae bacterium]|nr:CPBP family glutamic-type intramembrane protease [Polyangiaceae bacterium]